MSSVESVQTKVKPKGSSSAMEPLRDFIKYFFYIMPHYLLQLFHFKLFGLPDRDEENVQDKVVLVTGANSGIGKVVAGEMAMRGARVIMACRDPERGKKALEDVKRVGGGSKAQVELLKLDLGDLSSVRTFSEVVKAKYPRINYIVCNAGCAFVEGNKKTKDGFEINIGTNHLGHFLLINLLLDNVKGGRPSRIVMVSSTNQMHHKMDLDDLMLESCPNIGFRGYDNSKYANSLFAKSLAKRLEGTGVTTYSLCPGLVDTNIFKHLRWWEQLWNEIRIAVVGLTPLQGAATVLYCLLEKSIKNESGKVYRFSKIHEPMTQRLNDEDGERLWKISNTIVGLN